MTKEIPIEASKKTKDLLEKLIQCPEVKKWDWTNENGVIIKFESVEK